MKKLISIALVAVSYTHLDVYKRQVHGQAFGFCENDIVLKHRVDIGLSLIHILLIIPPTSISFSQFVRASCKKSIRCQPRFRRPRRSAGAARNSCRNA